MHIYFHKTNPRNWQSYPEPTGEDLANYYSVSVNDESELDGKILSLTGGNPTLIDGQLSDFHHWNGENWTLDTTAHAAFIAEKRQAKWEEIKQERFKRTHSGVFVKALNKWFQTDDSSRIQYLTLQNMPTLPPNLQWKTMDNSFVPMTKDTLNAVIATMIIQEQADFANAEKHRLALEQSQDPEQYDYRTGWSLTLAEWQVQQANAPSKAANVSMTAAPEAPAQD